MRLDKYLCDLTAASRREARERIRAGRVRVDGRDLFTYRDPQPLTHGYVGFRTTWSHQTIDGLTIHHIK